MQFTTIFLTALTALSTSVSGLALPALFTREKCIEDTPQYQQAKANQSTIFGLQLAGSAKNEAELDTTCSKLNEGAYSKWKQAGLLIKDIKQPICQSAKPNATLTLPLLAAANTNYTTHLLLSSFPEPSSIAYLCTNLRYKLLDALLLNSDTIISTLCNETKTPQAPQPFTPLAEENDTAVGDVESAAGRAFAWSYAAGLNTSAGLATACDEAPGKKSAWNKLQLNATAVEETLCSIKTPLSVDDAKSKIKNAVSTWYGVVLGGVSNADEWKEEVCKGLSCEGLEGVGLDGEVVRGVFGC